MMEFDERKQEGEEDDVKRTTLDFIENIFGSTFLANKGRPITKK